LLKNSGVNKTAKLSDSAKPQIRMNLSSINENMPSFKTLSTAGLQGCLCGLESIDGAETANALINSYLNILNNS